MLKKLSMCVVCVCIIITIVMLYNNYTRVCIHIDCICCLFSFDLQNYALYIRTYQ